MIGIEIPDEEITEVKWVDSIPYKIVKKVVKKKTPQEIGEEEARKYYKLNELYVLERGISPL